MEIDLGAALKLPMEYKITVTVQGIVRSPLTFGKDGEPSYNNPEGTEIPDNMGEIGKLDLLDNILYCPMSVLPVPVKGDLYITAQDRTLFDSFSNDYKAYVEEEKTALAGLLGDDTEVITLYDNYSFKSILSSADKVRGIGDILMFIFIAVTLLVVLSSMMRLMEEERAQIACLKTLGYSSFSAVMRYVLFALVALVAGGGGGFFVGDGVSWLMCYVFGYSYDMPPISVVVNPGYYFLSIGAILAVTVTAVSCPRDAHDGRHPRQPADGQTAEEGQAGSAGEYSVYLESAGVPVQIVSAQRPALQNAVLHDARVGRGLRRTCFRRACAS